MAKFLDYLRDRIHSRMSDVDEMCESHSLDLSDSLMTLKRFDPEVDQARQAARFTASSSQEWHKVVNQVLSLEKKLKRHWLVQSRILEILKIVFTYQPVLQLYREVQVLFDEKKYVLAIRKIDHLVRLLQPRHSNFQESDHNQNKLKFVQAIKKRIPILRIQIREEVVEQISDVLSEIRVNSSIIGLIALIHVGHYYSLPWRDILITDNMHVKQINIDSFDDFSTCDPNAVMEKLVNFEPLLSYRYLLHILGTCEEQIGHEWRQKRLKQADHLVSTTKTSTMYNVENFRDYLQDVISIFAVEKYVQIVAPGISNDAWSMALWKEVAPKVTQALRNSYIYIMDPSEVVKLKDMIVLFVLSIRHFSGDTTSHLIGLIEELREHYAEVLMTQLTRGIQKQLDDDNFQPVVLTSVAHCKDTVGDFPMAEPKEFPAKLQISRSVPGLYALFLDYVDTYANFCSGLPENKYRRTSLDDTIRRAILISIERTLTGCVISFCRGEDALALSQLVQIHENCRLIEYAFANRLDNLVNSRVMLNRVERVEAMPAKGSVSNKKYLIRDQCRPLFEDLRSQLREHIFSVVTGKIDELLLQIKNYDWHNVSESGDLEASPYMIQLTAYFREVIERTRGLLPEWLQSVFMHMSNKLHDQLYHAIIDIAPCLTSRVLQQIETDVKKYKRFVSHLSPDSGCVSGDIENTFSKLDQLLSVSLSWDWDTYSNEYHQTSRNKSYNLVKAKDAVIILEKLKEAEKGKDSNIFSGFRKSVRLLDQELKRLKQLRHEEEAAKRGEV